jgi:hypothetical protein
MASSYKDISLAIDRVFYGYEKIIIKKSIKNATIQQQKKKKRNLKRKDPTSSS